jgi:hypothetical protein
MQTGRLDLRRVEQPGSRDALERVGAAVVEREDIALHLRWPSRADCLKGTVRSGLRCACPARCMRGRGMAGRAWLPTRVACLHSRSRAS